MKQPPRNPTLLPGGPTKESEARPPELVDMDSEMGWFFCFVFFSEMGSNLTWSFGGKHT